MPSRLPPFREYFALVAELIEHAAMASSNVMTFLGFTMPRNHIFGDSTKRRMKRAAAMKYRAHRCLLIFHDDDAGQ